MNHEKQREKKLIRELKKTRIYSGTSNCLIDFTQKLYIEVVWENPKRVSRAFYCPKTRGRSYIRSKEEGGSN